jgi:hypothetical protein
MLTYQNFGRRHDHRLISFGDRLQNRRGGDNRFSAADIPLQETVHRDRCGHIVGDLVDHTALRAGQLEGDQAAHP